MAAVYTTLRIKYLCMFSAEIISITIEDSVLHVSINNVHDTFRMRYPRMMCNTFCTPISFSKMIGHG